MSGDGGARCLATAEALEHRMRVRQVGERRSYASAGAALVEAELGFGFRIGRVESGRLVEVEGELRRSASGGGAVLAGAPG